jgi:hypothetical protein
LDITNPIGLVGIGNWVDECNLEIWDGTASKDTAYAIRTPKSHAQDALRDFDKDFHNAQFAGFDLFVNNTQK